MWPIDKTLSGATTPGQSGPGSDDNEKVLCSLQSSSITGTSPSDCLVSYQDTRLESLTPSAEMLSVYSTAPANWATTFMDYLMPNPVYTYTEYIWLVSK